MSSTFHACRCSYRPSSSRFLSSISENLVFQFNTAAGGGSALGVGSLNFGTLSSALTNPLSVTGLEPRNRIWEANATVSTSSSSSSSVEQLGVL